jgi:DNA polymerase V
MEIIELFGLQSNSANFLSLFTTSVAAGFPVVSDSHVDKRIDLNEFLIEHPAATFFAHVSGNNLRSYGISDGDILIVDTSADYYDGRIVVASLNGNLSVKIFRNNDDVEYLQTDDERYLPLRISDEFEFRIIGCVTKVIHSL